MAPARRRLELWRQLGEPNVGDLNDPDVVFLDFEGYLSEPPDARKGVFRCLSQHY